MSAPFPVLSEDWAYCLPQFERETGESCETDYQVLSFIGQQSGGKSTLLNEIFHTSFDVMPEGARQQTTRGVNGALARHQGTRYVVFDAEGMDSVERLAGPSSDAMETRLAHWALAVSDVLCINIYYTDLGTYSGSQRALLRVLFSSRLRLRDGGASIFDAAGEHSQPRHIVFTVRDVYVRPDVFAHDTESFMAGIQADWDEAARGAVPLETCFRFHFVSFPHYFYCRDDFTQIASDVRFPLRVCPERLPLRDLPNFCERVWTAAASADEIDLSVHREMLADQRVLQAKTVAVATISQLFTAALEPVGQLVGQWIAELTADLVQQIESIPVCSYRLPRHLGAGLESLLSQSSATAGAARAVSLRDPPAIARLRSLLSELGEKTGAATCNVLAEVRRYPFIRRTQMDEVREAIGEGQAALRHTVRMATTHALESELPVLLGALPPVGEPRVCERSYIIRGARLIRSRRLSELPTGILQLVSLYLLTSGERLLEFAAATNAPRAHISLVVACSCLSDATSVFAAGPLADTIRSVPRAVSALAEHLLDGLAEQCRGVGDVISAPQPAMVPASPMPTAADFRGVAADLDEYCARVARAPALAVAEAAGQLTALTALSCVPEALNISSIDAGAQVATSARLARDALFTLVTQTARDEDAAGELSEAFGRAFTRSTASPRSLVVNAAVAAARGYSVRQDDFVETDAEHPAGLPVTQALASLAAWQPKLDPVTADVARLRRSVRETALRATALLSSPIVVEASDQLPAVTLFFGGFDNDITSEAEDGPEQVVETAVAAAEESVIEGLLAEQARCVRQMLPLILSLIGLLLLVALFLSIKFLSLVPLLALSGLLVLLRVWPPAAAMPGPARLYFSVYRKSQLADYAATLRQAGVFARSLWASTVSALRQLREQHGRRRDA